MDTLIGELGIEKKMADPKVRSGLPDVETLRSESKPVAELQRARITRQEPEVGSPWVIGSEGGIAWNQEGAADGGGTERGHVIEKATHELRVIEKVECLGADIEPEALRDIDALGE